MDADLSGLLSVGLLAILFAGSTLTVLVRADLLPAGAIAGRWFLAGGLGLGVVAFTIKMILVATISQFPGQLVARLIADVGKAGFDEPVVTAPAVSPGYVWQALAEVAPEPAANPSTPEKVALGRRLFFDPALSRDGKVACASCHAIEKAGADGRATALGISGVPGRRNTPTVWNAAFQSALFWDGRAASLEEQARGPLTNPDEMGMPSLAAVERAVRADASYREPFSHAFGAEAPITIDRIVEAIAAYERTLVASDAPYDRFVRGDDTALSPAQRRGMALFQSIGCVTCHAGPAFGGGRSPYRLFPANSSPYDQRYRLTEDKGRASADSRRGVWRIPSLRNVALTAPYFHNGAVTDLAEAVRVMAVSQLNAVLTNEGERLSEWSPRSRTLGVYARRVVSDRDVDDLVAFLEALTSPTLAAQAR